jgi:hypothetical protein
MAVIASCAARCNRKMFYHYNHVKTITHTGGPMSRQHLPVATLARRVPLRVAAHARRTKAGASHVGKAAP